MRGKTNSSLLVLLSTVFIVFFLVTSTGLSQTYFTELILATQYDPNTPNSKEVAVPDVFVKFAMLGWLGEFDKEKWYPGPGRVTYVSGVPFYWDSPFDYFLYKDNFKDFYWNTSFQVRITYRGKTVVAPIREVGPWNMQDNYWDEKNAFDPAQRRRLHTEVNRGYPQATAAFFGDFGQDYDEAMRYTNGAGIDISTPLAQELGFTGKDWVLVEFLWLPPEYQVGDWVQVNTGGSCLKVRKGAPGTPDFDIILTCQPDGTTGQILDGYIVHGRYLWWKIRWTDGWEGWSAGLYLDAATNNPPNTPTNQSPCGVSNISLIPTLQASSFSDPDGDGFAASQWQVDDSSSFSSPVWDSGEYSPVTSVRVPSGRLNYSTTYWWRVRYKDSRGAWSNWSSPCSFITSGGQPYPVVTSSLRIIENPPFCVGETISAQFTLKNKGTAPITFDVVTVGGRDPDDQVADFTWAYNITLDPNESYTYQGSLTLTKAGNYHFFCAYRTPDGVWNTSIPTESGVSNTLDIVCETIPNQPPGVSASDGTYPDRVRVTWNSVSGATRYEVYRATSSGGSYSRIASNVTTTSYDDTSVTPGQHYWYKVKACNDCGCSGYSSADEGWAQANPALCRSPSSLDFGTTATSKTFEVWNCGGGTLSYTISDDRPWISVSPTSGSSTGEHDTITVTVNRSGLSPGHYTGTVTIDPNYGANQTVTISMDVPEPLQFITDQDSVTIPEGGTATFQVKLSAQPSGTVQVNVSRVSGDSDITVTGGSSLTFTTTNWNTYQTVTLSAAEDADTTNGQATIRIHCTSGGPVPDKDVTATEQDNDGTSGDLVWTAKNNIPEGRVHPAVAVVGNVIHVLGGNVHRSHYVYDPLSDTWTTKADLPNNGVSEGGAAVVDSKIYVIGGPSDYEVMIYDPSADTWSTGAQLPTPRRGIGVAAVNGKIYAVGGTDANLNGFNIVEEYDPVADSWSEKAPMPTARGFATVAVVNGLIYIIGGRDGDSIKATVEVYDPATNAWSTKAPLPSGAKRLGAAGAVIGDRIYVIGGFNGGSYLDTVYEYNPFTDVWTARNGLPEPRFGAVAGVVNDKIYLIGGQNASGFVLTTLEGQLQKAAFNTIGLYNPASATFFLRNSNSAGVADFTFNYGIPNWAPIAGDWDGDGIDTVGLYNPASATFFLRNEHAGGSADITFNYGIPNWIPIAGDWDGDGIDTIGVYNPASATFFLKNSNSSGVADITFNYGIPNWIPIAGDWDGDGVDTVGLYNPDTATFFLRNSNSAGVADITFNYGIPNWVPITGDWDGDGIDTVGVYNPASATFFLRNSNSAGVADITFNYGVPNWVPIAGDWDGNGTSASSALPAVKSDRTEALQVSCSPNPLRKGGLVTFSVAGAANVQAIRVKVYNLAGELVWQSEAKGNALAWRADDLAGQPLANGVYLYVVEVKIADEWMHLGINKLLILR